MAALIAVDSYRRGTTPPPNHTSCRLPPAPGTMSYWESMHARAEAPIPTALAVIHRASLVAALPGPVTRKVAQQALYRTEIASTGEKSRGPLEDLHASHSRRFSRRNAASSSRSAESLPRITLTGSARWRRRAVSPWFSVRVTPVHVGVDDGPTSVLSASEPRL